MLQLADLVYFNLQYHSFTNAGIVEPQQSLPSPKHVEGSREDLSEPNTPLERMVNFKRYLRIGFNQF